jgi:DNA-binding response OmpR family regulator
MSRTVLGILRAISQPDEPCVLRRACERAKVTFQCESVNSAGEAVRYLSGTGEYGNRARHPMPTLVMVDLDLDWNEGYEALSWIRHHAGLRSLPVVAISQSKSQMDMKRAYDLGASSYLLKPVSFAGLVELVKLIDSFWLMLNQIPGA